MNIPDIDVINVIKELDHAIDILHHMNINIGYYLERFSLEKYSYHYK